MKEGFLLVAAGAFAAAAYLLINDDAEASEQVNNTSALTNPATGKASVGFQNNNPGNLAYISSNPFNGQVGQSNGYGVYDTLSDGVRAMGLQLTKYYQSGLTTVRGIISKWAPPSSNPTANYISYVANYLNVSPDDHIQWPEDEVNLVAAMIQFENGYQPITLTDLETYLTS